MEWGGEGAGDDGDDGMGGTALGAGDADEVQVVNAWDFHDDADVGALSDGASSTNNAPLEEVNSEW